MVRLSCFRHLTKDNTLQPYITQKDFTTSIDYPEYNRPGYNLYVFDVRYHQDFATLQPIKVKIEFSPTVDAATGLRGYAFLLTFKVISINSDGQRQFDSI